MSLPRFHGLKALVSGGGTGVGRAVALALAQQGAQVRIVGRSENSLREVVGRDPNHISQSVCDVSDSQAWSEVIRSIGPLDILINNAAISRQTDPLGEDEAAWKEILAVNFHGALVACREAAQTMGDRGGRIVNITSVHGTMCERGSTAYGVGKAAVNQLTRCLAVELAARGILVNAVAPGFVDTPMSRATGVNELETEWFKTNFIANNRIPLQRAARSEEIAPAVLFLASRDNTYITGQILTIDGGLTLTL